ncbi:dCTP deaminase [Candidatus Dojkabacteria bacterium]|nr:dCTP deaminase [Candidatus Dojkabacteria bacterium]
MKLIFKELQVILSDQDIFQKIIKEDIKIEPFDKNNIHPASYIFTLGNNLLKPLQTKVIDIKNNQIPEYKKISLDEIGYGLEPGELVLGQTLEKLTLPRDVAMIIEGRSTLARMGIEIIQESSFIEPDHSNSIITLEIINNSQSPIILYPGMECAKGIFIKLTSEYSGDFSSSTYTTQTEVEGPKFE